MEKTPSGETNFEQRMTMLRKEYGDLLAEKTDVSRELSLRRDALYLKWKERLGLGSEWGDVTEKVYAGMDDQDKREWDDIKKLEDIFDQRAFELHSAFLETMISNPSVTWVEKPRQKSFAGPYNRECSVEFDEGSSLSLHWMTQPKNMATLIYMPNGEARTAALNNRIDTLTLSINRYQMGPMGVQGNLGISISRQFGEDKDYSFPEEVALRFQANELNKLKSNMVTLKERVFSDSLKDGE